MAAKNSALDKKFQELADNPEQAVKILILSMLELLVKKKIFSAQEINDEVDIQKQILIQKWKKK